MVKLDLIGHLGGDAQIQTVNGKTVINFSVAHSETWTDNNGEKQSRTKWFSCNYWNDKTRVAEFLKKGTQVFVTGTPDAKIYQGQKGEPVAQITLRINEIQLLGSKKEGE